MAQRFYWKQYVTDKQVTFYIADLILKPGEQIEAHCHDYYEFFCRVERHVPRTM